LTSTIFLTHRGDMPNIPMKMSLKPEVRKVSAKDSGRQGPKSAQAKSFSGRLCKDERERTFARFTDNPVSIRTFYSRAWRILTRTSKIQERWKYCHQANWAERHGRHFSQFIWEMVHSTSHMPSVSQFYWKVGNRRPKPVREAERRDLLKIGPQRVLANRSEFL